jgi:GTPase SAR1 family protein
MKTNNSDFSDSETIKNESSVVEDLQPYLVDFREFSHIAYELGQAKYSSWFESDFEREDRIKHAHQLSRQALQFLQWENGSQENERVRVAVIGDFSSGKSSFINSLLGQKICPVNVAASTSSITTFKYGDDEAIYLVGDRDSTDQAQRSPLGRHEYEQMVTHQGQQVKPSSDRHEFEIYYPFDGFREIELYDTPGFNNAENSEDEQITLDKCRNADVILFVFDINKGDLSADILNKVLMPLRQEKPDQPMIAIVNKADTKPPSKVEEIGNGIRAKNIFNQVIDYSSLDEMDAWNELIVSASPEHIFDSIKRTAPCKIKSHEKGFVFTPLNPRSVRREPILQWMKAIRGQKAILITAKRQSELAEYQKHGGELLKTLQKISKKKTKGENVESLSCREKVLKAVPPDGIGEALKSALSSSIETALSFKKITSGDNKGWFSPNYQVLFSQGTFGYKINIQFETVKNLLSKFVVAIPIECSEYVELSCEELLKRISHPETLFKPLCDELMSKEWSIASRVFGEKSEAVTFCEEVAAFALTRGIDIFFEQVATQANFILEQLDIYEAKNDGSAEVLTEQAQIFNARIKQFADSFCSRNMSLIESEAK